MGAFGFTQGGVGLLQLTAQFGKLVALFALLLRQRDQLAAVVVSLAASRIVLGIQVFDARRGAVVDLARFQQGSRGGALLGGGGIGGLACQLQLAGQLAYFGGGLLLFGGQRIGLHGQVFEGGNGLRLLAYAANLVGQLLKLGRSITALFGQVGNRVLQCLDVVLAQRLHAQGHRYIAAVTCCHGCLVKD